MSASTVDETLQAPEKENEALTKKTTPQVSKLPLSNGSRKRGRKGLDSGHKSAKQHSGKKQPLMIINKK